MTSLGLAAAALFCVGAIAGRLAHRNMFAKGLEVALFGAAVFALSYGVGRYVPPLFGLHPAGSSPQAAGGFHLPTIVRAMTSRWICCVPS